MSAGQKTLAQLLAAKTPVPPVPPVPHVPPVPPQPCAPQWTSLSQLGGVPSQTVQPQTQFVHGLANFCNSQDGGLVNQQLTGASMFQPCGAAGFQAGNLGSNSMSMGIEGAYSLNSTRAAGASQLPPRPTQTPLGIAPLGFSTSGLLPQNGSRDICPSPLITAPPRPLPSLPTPLLLNPGSTLGNETNSASLPRVSGAQESLQKQTILEAMRAVQAASGSTTDTSEAAAKAAIEALTADPHSAQHQMFMAMVGAQATNTSTKPFVEVSIPVASDVVNTPTSPNQVVFEASKGKSVAGNLRVLDNMPITEQANNPAGPVFLGVPPPDDTVVSTAVAVQGPNPDCTLPPPPPSALNWLAVGDAVEAQCVGWGSEWYPGVVRALLPNGEVQVLWDGVVPSISNVVPSFVRQRTKKGGALPVTSGADLGGDSTTPSSRDVCTRNDQAAAASAGVANGSTASKLDPLLAVPQSNADGQDPRGKLRPREESAIVSPRAVAATASQSYRYDLGPGDDIVAPIANLRRRVEVELRNGSTVTVSLHIVRSNVDTSTTGQNIPLADAAIGTAASHLASADASSLPPLTTTA